PSCTPGQARAEPATAASDISSLGIVLFELLTGTRPFEGDTAAAVGLARLSGPAPDPMAVRASVPPDLAAITRKAMAPEPGDRFVSASAMADALDGAVAANSAAAAAGAGVAGTAAVGAAAGMAAGAAMSGTARGNPNAVPYAPDAYAGGDDVPPPVAPAPRPPDDEGGGTSPIVWIA